MTETRKLAAILVSDVVGYSRLAGADEDRILARLRALRSDLIDPIIAVQNGRVVKRTGDGAIVEFRSVVDAVRCAIEVQNGMVERNAGLPPERRIEFRIGIHLGDVVVESDGDLMGDGVNIAARLEGLAAPGSICLSEDAYRQVKTRLDLAVSDLGATQLKNIAEPIRVYSLQVGVPAQAKPAAQPKLPSASTPPRLSIVVLPFANLGGDPEQEYFVDGVTESLTTDLSRISGSFVIGRNTAFTYKGKHVDLKRIGRELNVRYVLEGSVQRGGNRIRVNVQLINSETGNHLWAERFDKPVADFFDMQDEIVARLANQLSAQLIEAEAQHAELSKSTDLDSLDLTFRGLAAFNRGLDPANIEQAEQFFNKALALDAMNVEALAGLGLERSLSANLPRAFLDQCRSDRISGGGGSGREKGAQDFTSSHKSASRTGVDIPGDQSGRAEHCRVRRHNCIGSEPGERIRLYCLGESVSWACRGDRRRYQSRASPQPARYVHLLLVQYCRRCKAGSRQGRRGYQLVSTIDRGQSEQSAQSFLSRRCAGPSRTKRRGRDSREGRP